MFQIDNSSAIGSMPSPTAAGSPGYFTDGNPATGLPATILSAEFMNTVMMELVNIVKAAGVTPDKTLYNQVLSSIQAMILKYASDTGAANAYQVTPPATVSGYSPGLYLRFKVANSNTGASTLNLMGPNNTLLGAKNIVRRDGSAVQPGDLPAGSIAAVIYDGTNFQLLSPTTQYTYRKNAAINGNFDFWQRGTPVAYTNVPNNNYYGPDRWLINVLFSGNSNVTFTRQAFAPGQGVVPDEPKYWCDFSWQINTGTLGANDSVTFEQRIEGVRTFAGKTVTISFWIKGAANGTLYAQFLRNFGTGGTASTSDFTTPQSVPITTSWNKVSLTFNIPSLAGKSIGTDGNDFIRFALWLAIGSTTQSTYGMASAYSANGSTYSISHVQIEEGAAATPFEYRSMQQEEALCLRYYEAGTWSLNNACTSGATLNIPVQWKVRKRSSPTVGINTTSTNVGSAITLNTASADAINAYITPNVTGSAAIIGTYSANAEL